MEYPIPKKSAEAWQKHQGRPGQNPGLIFDRFAPDWHDEATLKKGGLVAVRDAATRGEGALLTAWNARWEKGVRHANADPFALKTDWRFIAGLGRKGPLEVGFTFHRYGFPMLPGSSVKGLARAYAWLVEGRRETDPDFLTIFGRAPQKGEDESVAQTGSALFFDAIPRQLPKLELDIMTPHFPDYYGDKNNRVAPTDSQNPKPVPFLTVAPSTEFRFAVGWRGQLNEEAHRLRNLATDWLVGGLTELGAGAKTSAGYGYFTAPRR